MLPVKTIEFNQNWPWVGEPANDNKHLMEMVGSLPVPKVSILSTRME